MSRVPPAQLDTVIASFLEGFIAPLIEICLSMLLLATYEFVELLQAALRPLNTPAYTGLSAETLTVTIEAFGLIDLARNAIFALVEPGNAAALAAGETLSLFLIASIPPRELIAESLWSAYGSCVFSIVAIVLGLIIRYAVSILAEV